MKTTAFLVMVFCIHVSAASLGQTKVSLEMSSTFGEVVEQLEKMTEYRFVIKADEPILEEEVEVTYRNMGMDKVLDDLLDGTGYSYKIIDRYIAITLADNNLTVAQQNSVSGRVTDTNGDPLPGVTVIIKGTTNGTVTDFEGNYSISGVASDDILRFSFVGMLSQEIKVANQTSINVAMKADAIGIDEVVAIGYGTTTKRKAVGAMSTIKREKLEETPFVNVGQALQGQVAGLIVENSGGAPGSQPSLSIRGGGTPMYVIDGVISSSADFNAINSNDIESINFLKDASATAVYGSRAGDGIVLVTTKKGEDGALQINYSYNYNLSQPTVLPETLNSYDYALLQNAANAYDGNPASYSPEVLEIIKNHSDLDTYPDNDWIDMTLKNFATEQRHNLSLRGGNTKSNYFISFGYVDQGGILKTDVINYERYNVRSNFATNFDKIGLKIGVNVNASLENYEEPWVGMYSIWRAITQQTSPLYRAYNADGTLAGGGNGDNPMALIDEDEGYNRTRDKFVNAQLKADWDVPGVEGLRVGIMGNYRDGDGWDKSWQYNVPLYMPDGSLAIQNAPALEVKSYYSKRMYFESSINYARTFGKHGVEGTFVYNQSTTNYEAMMASRRDYQSGAVDQLFAGSAVGKDNDGNETESANAGYVIRLKYDYNYKYIVEFSGRYDGNDNFAPSQRWGFFPAGALAWNVTEESFMDDLKSKNVFNSLKVRASYGETGITTGVNRFGYIPVYNLESSIYTIGNSLVNGYTEGDLVNPEELTWYSRRSLNYGLDFTSLDNHLSGTLEYFYYRTTGYLMSPENVYSQPLGKSLPQVKSNSAHRREGFELSFRYKNNLGKLFYDIGVNYSRYNQLWEQKDDEDEATLMNPYTRETQRTDYWEGGAVYLSDGLYQNGDEILDAARLLASEALQSGDIRYQDVNGDGKIDVQDQRLIGLPSSPHANYGIDFNLKYQGWFMNGLFQGTGDRYVAFDHFLTDNANRRTISFQNDYWTSENPDALYPRVSHSTSTNGGNNHVSSDYYLMNSRYFRLKNLQVGYDLKKSLLANTSWISSCKVYVSGTNLFTISDVMDYFDPEQASTGGVQTYGYPVQRTYSFGINVGF